MKRLGLAAILLIATPVGAQVGRSLSKSVAKVDLAAIAPVVQAVLNGEAVGGFRPWTGSDGSTGNVRLISGGAKAGAPCGHVRLTVIRNSVEHTGYKFRYCRAADGQWKTAG